MPPISSLQNVRVKAALRLRDRRHREKQGRILIDGVREVGRAARAGIEIQEVFWCPALLQGDDAQPLRDLLVGTGTCLLEVTEPVFSKLAFGERAEGVLAIAATPQRRLEDLRLPPEPLVAVIEGVEKPGNVGAVLRSADGAGLSALIVADGRTVLFNPNAIRASLGTIFTLPVCEATTAETLAWLRRAGMMILAARVEGSVSYTQADFRGPTAIVLGSEATGLTEQWQGDDVVPIRLPMRGMADSLNVSAAAAVLFYEALRQRGG